MPRTSAPALTAPSVDLHAVLKQSREAHERAASIDLLGTRPFEDQTAFAQGGNKQLLAVNLCFGH